MPTVSITLEPVEFVYVRDLVRSRGPTDIISSVQISLQQKLEGAGWMTSNMMITLDVRELSYLTALIRVHRPDIGVAGIHDSIAQKLMVASAPFLEEKTENHHEIGRTIYLDRRFGRRLSFVDCER